jgi:threonine dehydrogenase-like Zn-dependent dehydrogenase
MKALAFDRAGLAWREVPTPQPGPGEALIKVELAGICRTDLEITAGYMSFAGVLGHEFVGRVVQAGDDRWTGKRVVGEINLNCGRCDYCRSGLGRHCPTRTVLGIAGKDGAFAEYLTLPLTNLHEVPAAMSSRTAVFTEPVAACYEILTQVELAGKKVAVMGDGKLGILAARVLAGEGTPVILVGRHPEKLALARGPMIQTILWPDFAARVSRPEEKFDVVVEATGRPEGFAAALAAARSRGTIVQKTTVAAPVPVDLGRLVVDELTVIGSRCGPFPPALAALQAGRVRVEDLIAGEYPFARGVQALQAAARPGALKILINLMGGTGAGTAGS